MHGTEPGLQALFGNFFAKGKCGAEREKGAYLKTSRYFDSAVATLSNSEWW